MADTEDVYMKRCLQLAKLGNGFVAPNPMVGAVLVYENRIIGEGYHQNFGEPHAEVNCINNVHENDKQYISLATLYVSLEPCAHYGKTPPCTNLIIDHKVPRVVIGCKDLFTKVNGKGIALLQDAGIEVIVGVLEKECIELNKKFFTFHQLQRPYIILKWAQSVNGFIGNNSTERLLISNDSTNRIVHKWRSEEAAIMVGSNTVIKDNPKLSNRLWSDKQPIRFVLDGKIKVGFDFNVLDQTQPTVIFNYFQQNETENLIYQQLNKRDNALRQIMNYAYQHNIQSILIEGGATLLQLFININCWDEARVITNTNLYISEGIVAPCLSKFILTEQENILTDLISYYQSIND